VDEDRIRALTEEVLAKLRTSGSGEGDLESRLAALEGTVRRLEAGSPSPAPVVAVAVAAAGGPVAHPALRLLDVPGGSEHCVLEPDKPCCQSGRCKTFGY
jgi:hypothetical protein